jgi:hypothetical protein
MNVDTLIEKRQDIEELLGTIAHLQNMLTDGHECSDLNQCLDYFWDDLKGDLRTRCKQLAQHELKQAKGELEDLLK